MYKTGILFLRNYEWQEKDFSRQKFLDHLYKIDQIPKAWTFLKQWPEIPEVQSKQLKNLDLDLLPQMNQLSKLGIKKFIEDVLGLQKRSLKRTRDDSSIGSAESYDTEESYTEESYTEEEESSASNEYFAQGLQISMDEIENDVFL